MHEMVMRWEMVSLVLGLMLLADVVVKSKFFVRSSSTCMECGWRFEIWCGLHVFRYRWHFQKMSQLTCSRYLSARCILLTPAGHVHPFIQNGS